jgi:hypothetical protein
VAAKQALDYVRKYPNEMESFDVASVEEIGNKCEEEGARQMAQNFSDIWDRNMGRKAK